MNNSNADAGIWLDTKRMLFSLNLDGSVSESLFALSLLLGLESHNSTTPLSLVLVELLGVVGVDGRDDGGEVALR